MMFSKDFQFARSQSFQFRVELFNIENRLNYENPAASLPGSGTPGVPFTDAQAGTFGYMLGPLNRTVGLGTARQTQVSLQLYVLAPPAEWVGGSPSIPSALLFPHPPNTPIKSRGLQKETPLALRFRLIPENEDFYVQFIALAEQLRIGAGCSSRCLRTIRSLGQGRRDQGGRAQVRPPDAPDHPAAERTFVTPIDREDLYALAKSLDDVMDAIDASARFVRLYKIQTIRFGARELARVVSLERRSGAAGARGAREAHRACRTRRRDQPPRERGRSHP